MSDVAMLRCNTVERSYDELHARAARIAAGLRGLGIAAGDNVAIVLGNSVEFLEVTTGIALAGANPVPVNWHWKSEELHYLFDNSESKAAFVGSDFLATVEETGTAIPLLVVPTDGAAAADPRDYGSWLDSQDADGTEFTPSVGLGMIYTSGTTGRPKGIVREPVSAERILQVAMATMQRMGLGPGVRTLIPAPLYHTAPNTMAVLAMKLGMEITVMPRFDAEEFLAAVERHRVQQVQMVPTMFTRLLRLPDEVRGRYDVSSLQTIVHSAAPCPPHIKRAIIDWFGPIVNEYYGGSETGPAVWCTSEEWLAHPGTVGCPADGAQVRIIDPDTREHLPTGQVGVIYIKPADYWPGFTYHHDDNKRREMELDGFVTVGDMGRLDDDGYLYLTDRANDMVISGGVNIYPAEIEAVLYEMPAVRDCAVFGIPDEEYGESLAAHIEVDGGFTVTADEVRDFLRERLAGFKVPKTIVFDDNLPREDSGKLFKRKIRDRYWGDTEAKI